MPVKSGLGASIGVSKETAYGTYVAPARHFLFTSESLDLDQTYYKNKSLQSGSYAQQKSLVRATTRTAGGNVSFAAPSKGLGVVLDGLTGATVTPTGSGTAKTYEFPIGLAVPDGKWSTWQVGLPDTAGTVQPKTMIGSVVESFKIAAEVGGALEVDLGLAGQDLVYTQSLATPTYPAGFELFGFQESTLTFDGGAIGSCVKSFEATVTLPRNKERFCLNGSGVSLEPLTNDHVTVAGSMMCEFTGLAQVNAFKAATWRALKLQSFGTTNISTGPDVKAELTIDIANFLVEKATPMAAGPDVITLNLDFTAAISGADPLAKFTYVTTDTAL